MSRAVYLLSQGHLADGLEPARIWTYVYLMLKSKFVCPVH